MDCYLGRNTGDPVVFTGNGVDDLGRTIDILGAPNALQPGYRLLIDLGGQYSSYRPFDLEDLSAIRTYYIGFYGTVAKPVVWNTRQPGATEVQDA